MKKQTFTPDRLTRGLLGTLTFLLAIIAVELWAGRPSLLPAASAQIPDTALQRNQQLMEIRRTNQLLDKILVHLQTKPIKVQAADTDQKSGSARKRSGRIGRGG